MGSKPIVRLRSKEAEKLVERVHETIILLYDSRLSKELSLIEKHAANCLERLKFKPTKGDL